MSGKPGVRGLLVDLDGVLYDADHLIAGAADTVRWLQTQASPHLFVTNTTSKSRAALAEKLVSFGIPAGKAEILTPAVAAAEWLPVNGKGEIALFVRPSARLDFQDLPCLPPDDAERGAACVAVGDLGPEAKLIALGMTRYWLAPSGISLDVAPFVAALEHATGRKALVVGKPAAAFFRIGTRRLGLPARRVLMIGDDIQADVGGAQRAGLRGVLVKTGKFRPADLAGKIRPYMVLQSIADLPRWWAENA